MLIGGAVFDRKQYLTLLFGQQKLSAAVEDLSTDKLFMISFSASALIVGTRMYIVFGRCECDWMENDKTAYLLERGYQRSCNVCGM